MMFNTPSIQGARRKSCSTRAKEGGLRRACGGGHRCDHGESLATYRIVRLPPVVAVQFSGDL